MRLRSNETHGDVTGFVPVPGDGAVRSRGSPRRARAGDKTALRRTRGGVEPVHLPENLSLCRSALPGAPRTPGQNPHKGWVKSGSTPHYDIMPDARLRSQADITRTPDCAAGLAGQLICAFS
ncbi:hypothetical protein AAFF_G00120920 [Aldrovandia affinis]|uniref:Uncharacterized protein n=1 Tax=Aldrovandia affinis TaxID=143900 RepID=A0AAD7WB22_9TELE|nr:hypothetical protein AAFF_G00120920 [Aldrovandia affinis]